jgi:hypothetical protein
MATLGSMQTASGTCLVRTGLYASGWRIFARNCEGWTAPPGVPANEPTKALATDFTRPMSRGDELNAALAAGDLASPNDLPPRWPTQYANHPRPRG